MQKEFCGSRREVRCAMRGRALARGFQNVCPGTMPRRTRIGGVLLLYCCAIPEYYVHLDITTRDHLTGTAMLRLRHTRMYRDGYRRCWIPVARRVLSRTLEGLRDIDAMYTDAWRQQVTTTTPDGALRVLGIVIGIDVPMRYCVRVTSSQTTLRCMSGQVRMGKVRAARRAGPTCPLVRAHPAEQRVTTIQA